MADLTQSKSTIIAHQAVTNPASVKGSAVDVRASLGCKIVMRHAYIEAVDPGGIEPEFHVMASDDQTASPPSDSWYKVVSFKATDPGAAPATEAMTATEPIAETVLACSSTTGFAAGDEVYVRDTTTEADSEWHQVSRVVTNTSVDLVEGLVTQKDSSDIIWGSAQTFRVSLGSVGHVNVYYSNEGSSAPNTAVYAEVLVDTDIE